MPYEFKHGDRPIEGLTVQRAVGRGGFGEVYYALTDSGKQVALKYLRENPEVELRGIAQVMNLKSPHLITIYDVRSNAAGEPFVIMEYVSGPSLRELLINEPHGLGPQKAAFFLKGIGRGLSYLHERGIVHRDLKPGNIFYDDGYVKIGDYGLSKHMSMSQHSGQTVSVGTVHYMAPEIGSGSYTQAIDIYALGVILYEMLTGRLPFSGSSMGEVLMRHLRDAPDLSGIPAPFAPVIAKALAKDPADRYQSADEMVAAVMESADVSASLDSFDASALTQVPRVPTASDDEQTVTSTPAVPPVPPLDVRAGAMDGALPKRLQRKLDHLNAKLERRARKLTKRYGPGHGGGRAHGHRGHRPTQHGSRLAQVLMLLIVTAAIATALGFLHQTPSGDPPTGVILAFYLAAATVGPLLAHLRFLQRSITRHVLLDRLVYASVAGLFMLPFAAAAADSGDPHLARVMLAPMAAMVICDWGRRIEIGRRGTVDGGSAFWPAMVGLGAAMVFHAQDCVLVAAGLNAALVLITQVTAALWPVKPTAPQVDILGAGHSAMPTPPIPPVGPPQADRRPSNRRQQTRLMMGR